MRCGNPYLGQGIHWLTAFCIPQWLLRHPSPSIAHTPASIAGSQAPVTKYC